MKHISHADMGIVPKVTPRAGVWIETRANGAVSGADGVTPRAGVWIETTRSAETMEMAGGHSPCGSVD